MYSKLTTTFLVMCFVASVLSASQDEDSDEDYEECSYSTTEKINQRISLQKCEQYKSQTVSKYYYIKCKLQKDYNYCKMPTDISGIPLPRDAAREYEFPHMARVGYESNGVRSYTCAGTLISDKFVLTAAHCTSDKKGIPPNIVRLSSVSESSPQAIFKNITEIIVHPDYTTNKANDLALLKLAWGVNFMPGKLRPACLWTKDRLENDTAISTGWGATGFAESASEHLIKEKLNLVDIEECQKAFGAQKVHDEYHICATDSTGEGRGTCQGDSGGPLQVTQPDNPCMSHIIGVMSKGQPCGVSNSYGVYMKVSKFIDWIEKVVWNAKS